MDMLLYICLKQGGRRGWSKTTDSLEKYIGKWLSINRTLSLSYLVLVGKVSFMILVQMILHNYWDINMISSCQMNQTKKKLKLNTILGSWQIYVGEKYYHY